MTNNIDLTSEAIIIDVFILRNQEGNRINITEN